MKDAEKLIGTIEAEARRWDISSVLSIRDREGFHYEKAFGYADRAAGRPMDLDQRFCLHAENGFFLSLCAMHLAERKMLRLADPISRWLPEYAQGGRVRVRDLLRWDAGIPDHWTTVRMPALQKDPAHAALSDRERFVREYELHARDIPFSELMNDVGGMELTHDPGVEDDGGETGFLFLAEIIRRASGMAPREYLFNHFFAPLGMDDTRPGNDATAALYGAFRDTELIPLPQLAPADAFTTTLRDMDKLARALAEKRFFSERTWQTMLKCNADGNGIGFIRRGDLYAADLYPMKLRNVCRLLLGFDDGVSILMLDSEEPKMALNENRRWTSFPAELRRAWQDTRVYPRDPQLKRINGKNVRDAVLIEVSPEQLAFVPECSRCIASTLARRQPAYVLMDHGTAVGMAGLTIRPEKKDYDITFLQVDRRYQGRGYGRILLTRAMEILKGKGADRLTIGVNRFNRPALALYRSVGFTEKEVLEEFVELEMKL